MPLILVVALFLAGCSFGGGTPYPGAAIRHRKYLTCTSVQGSTCYGAQRHEETGGGGSLGVMAGGPIGGGRIQVGERSALAVGGAARLDANVILGPVGLGLAGEFAYAFGSLGPRAEPTSVGFLGFPVSAYLVATPVQPFLIRAGVTYASGTASFDDMETEVSGTGYFAALGLLAPFPGLHWVPVLEWRRLDLGEITTDLGREALTVDTYMFTLWNVY